MARICIWGSSSTYGLCDERGGWAHRLRIALEKEKTRVFPLGIPGDTSDCVVARLDTELEARHPDIALFSIGTNDSKYYGDDPCYLSLEEFQDNLEYIYKKASKRSKVAFIGLTRVDETRTQPVAWDALVNYGNKEIIRYNDALKRFCEEHGIPFLDVFDLLDDQDLEDGLHPNTRGHEKLYERIRPFVRGL